MTASMYDEAFQCEITAASALGGERYLLTNARYLGDVIDGFLYQVHVDRPCYIPDESGVKISTFGQSLEAIVVSISGLEVVLSTERKLGDQEVEQTVTMIVDFSFILTKLRDCFEAASCSRLFEQVARDPGGDDAASHGPEVLEIVAGLNDDQRRAVLSALTPGVRFIWGPPGTGKTRTVGHLAAAAAVEGKTVLVVSYSNVAVDVAMLALAAAAPSRLRRPGTLVRIGTARRDDVRAHDWLTAQAVLRHRYPELHERLRELEKAHQSLTADRTSEPERSRVRSDIQGTRARIRAHENQLAATATVVGCTLARLVCDPNIRQRCFDVVILDEASMASIPFAHAASRRAKHTVVYAGDFRQLPPIVLSRAPVAKRWLGRDVFDHASLPNQEQAGKVLDSRVTLLRTQYRMHTAISQVVSSVFYAGKLRGQVDGDVAHIASRPPFPVQVISVVDLRRVGPYCEAEPQARGKSRFNVLSAITSVTFAHQAASAGSSVGIITPYRAQSSLVRAMLQDLRLDDVQVSTVHRFQGSEVDTVILDLTAARGKDGLGDLLGGDAWSTAGRLLNVAVSRARGKLTILVDGEFLANQWVKAAATGGASSQALKQLLDALPSPRSVDHRSLAEWFGSLPAPRGFPAVRLHDAPMHDSRMGNRIGAAKRQLFLYVRPPIGGQASRPGGWVERSKVPPGNDPRSPASVTGRGAVYGPSW